MQPTDIKSMDTSNNFQEKPIWIFITLIVILIGATPACSELFLDFFPDLKEYQRWVKLSFIAIFIFVLGATWWKEEQKKREQDMSDDEKLEKSVRQALWMTWRQNFFRHYPLNIKRQEGK